MINRDRAVIDVINHDQGDQYFTEFLAKIEYRVKLTRANVTKITEDNLTRMAVIVSTHDRSTAKKTLAENYILAQTIQLAVKRESRMFNTQIIYKNT